LEQCGWLSAWVGRWAAGPQQGGGQVAGGKTDGSSGVSRRRARGGATPQG